MLAILNINKYKFCFSAVKESRKYLKEKHLSLKNYNYSTDFLDALISGLLDVSFDGVSVN